MWLVSLEPGCWQISILVTFANDPYVCRPTHTTVTESPNIIFLKGGLFRESGYNLEFPFKEQWWHRAETWERPYVSTEVAFFNSKTEP